MVHLLLYMIVRHMDIRFDALLSSALTAHVCAMLMILSIYYIYVCYIYVYDSTYIRI